MAILKHTPKEVAEREAVMINPAKTCQPVGAMYASLGIHGCLPHSHGSQGCCSYHRTVLTRHYKDPVMAATSSFTEGSSVFGGQSNLIQGLKTMFTVYKPEVVAIHTTCLSETIGDDITQITAKAIKEGFVPEGKYVIHANTPSYIGSHITGFSNMVTSMAKSFAEPSDEKKPVLNIIPGWVEPADMREIKRMMGSMGVKHILFPDTSDVVDSPLKGKFEMYPKGGTTVEELKATGSSKATVALGQWASWQAAKYLDASHKVPCELLELPLGLEATDKFLDTVRKITGKVVSEELEAERGRLLDVMMDMHQYLYGKTVALVGDPDQLVSLTEFCLSLDMKPKYVLTGSPAGKKWNAKMAALTEGLDYEVKYKEKGDQFLLHQWIKNESVDLLIGNTHGKMIAADEDIPLSGTVSRSWTAWATATSPPWDTTAP
jgi:nitrogenase molybdenum-iron protein beta chain